MKINKLFAIGALLATGLAFTACSDDDWSGPGEVSDGAYLYSDATSFSFLPEDEQSFTIHVGRTQGAAAKAGTVSLSGDNDAFVVPEEVNFAAGETKQDVKITFNIPAGTTQTLRVALAGDSVRNIVYGNDTLATSGQSTVYGNDTLTIRVTRDYNWKPAGSGTFTDNTFGVGQTTVVVQHADGTNIYRLVSPYYTLSSDDFASKEHVQFTLAEDGTVGFRDGIYDIFGTSGYEMYYDNGNYPGYCNVSNEDGTLTWNFLILQGTSLYTGGNFIFEWLDGYPLDN